MGYLILKDRHRAERDAWHPNLSLRVHRALSWLDRAEQRHANLHVFLIGAGEMAA